MCELYSKATYPLQRPDYMILPQWPLSRMTKTETYCRYLKIKAKNRNVNLGLQE